MPETESSERSKEEMQIGEKGQRHSGVQPAGFLCDLRLETGDPAVY